VRFTIVGPGALGCLTAYFLARGGHGVTLVGRNAARLAAIRDKGLTRVADGTEHTVAVDTAPAAAAAPEADAVLLCVKSHDVEAAARSLAPVVTGRSVVIALQNGIGHHGVLARILPRHALGVTAVGATLTGPGRFRFGGMGETRLGFTFAASSGDERALAATAAAMTRAGLAASVSDDIIADVWNKLIVNIGINPLTAIHGCANGELLARPELRRLQQQAVAEAARVAEAKGIAITGDPAAMVRDVCRKTCANISSMLQDMRAGRRTEIDAITGALVAEARTLGVAVPVNTALLDRVRAMERDTGGARGVRHPA